jgi:hypothetical protein
VTEHELYQALRLRFPAQEYAVLPQVGNKTGSGVSRHADALALSLWPSRGICLHGFEIKSHRGDWLRELQNPEKADTIARFCHYWWVVAPKDVVKDDELPLLWGHLDCPPGKPLRKVKQAPFRKETEPIGMDFIAAMLRQAQEVVTPAGQIAESFEKGKKAGLEERKGRERYDLEDYERLKKTVNDFRKASGIIIEKYCNGTELGEAVRMVMSGSVGRRAQDLRRVAQLILKELPVGEDG